jgi:predicted PurR-regulated permease PerM
LAGLGLSLAGVPGPAILGFVVFLLCVVQLGPALVLVPAAVWTFWQGDLYIAILFAAWCVFIMLMDNVLRPYLMTRGGSVPLAVILVGVLGGLVAHGLIGLFLGPIVLALGWELSRAWVQGPAVPGPSLVPPG